MQLFPKLNIVAIGWVVARVALIIYVLNGVLLFVRQDAMLFFPDNTSFTDCAMLAGVTQIEESGTRGYFFQNGTSTKLAVLYHGNAGRACDRNYYRIAFEQAGYSWLIVEYGGFSGDGKKASVASLLRDTEHVVQWVNKSNFSYVAVVGESIGSGPASYHASLAPVEKLVLITPFAKVADVARKYLPVYPIALMLHNDFDSGNWAAHAKQVLVIHGTGDTIIPFSCGKALFDVLPQKQKEFLILPGIDHNDAPALGQTQDAMMYFLQN